MQYSFSFVSVDGSGSVLHTVREKEKPYTPDQEQSDVVQPYAAYSPAGHPKVKLSVFKSNQL